MADRAYLQTEEQWTRFLSMLVHEMRTPLASLHMLADLLAESPGNARGEAEKRHADSIQKVVRDIQGLLGEVADLARLLAGRLLIRLEEVALGPLIDKVEEEVRPRAWEKGIALTDSLDPSLPRLLRTDPDRLRQALVLLLGAAVSQAESEVFFRLDADQGSLHVVISSDGPPFPNNPPGQLFEPFAEGVQASRPRGGHSLALPLANELIRILGGTLEAGNRGGSPAFDLSLPAAPAAPAAPG
jgi:signal transduction histidine kinase